VQEGLANQDVLGPVGFDLCVCSSQSGHAQSVYDMVYGDSQALATCPIEFQHVNLCNQVYIRKNSGWKVVERGSMPISSDLMLAGLGGRRHGKLAVRSMVWLKLQAPEANSPFVYVMCTHITGGRFEDQYFMQSLTEERKTQLTNIIDFYNNRVGASEEDVGIIVGDFNATTVYTSKGTMHGYFAASILPSEGVQEDAKWILTPKARERGMDVVLEEHFKEYMISPFKAITESGWTFAYDRQHVGYTSGFGHTIDHMVMSRPLLVESAEVVYMTNQKFGNKQADTDLVLTDHNAVKTTFKIDLPEKIHTFVCRTESDFLNYLKRYRAIVYITGFGQKQQYADLETAVAEVAKPLFEGAESLDVHFGKGKWVACYGGDPLDRNRTDVALLVDRLQKKYQMHLIAIQADKVEKELGVDKSIEAVYYYPTEYKKGADGGQEVAWGGYVDGKTVGTTRILLEVNPLSELPLFWIAAGGGDIAADELSSAYNNLTAVMHIECKAKFPQDPSQPFGPCLNIWNSLKDCDTIGGGDANRAWRRKEGTEG
jgi:endonuclease/exonuclease/phosphatase family metal-dependent hydrolase